MYEEIAKKKHRLEYVDAARGIAILLVIAGHLIQDYHADGNNCRVLWFICSFHMPLFFAVSGYIGQVVSKPIGGGKNYLQFIGKKAVALLVPLYVWTLVVNKYFFSSTWSVPQLIDVLETFTKPGALWFLPTLFRLFVFYGLFQLYGTMWNSENKFWKDALFILALVAFLAFNPVDILKNDLPYTIHFYVAVIIAKHDKIRMLFFNERVFVTTFFIFCVLACHWNQLSASRIYDAIRLVIALCAFLIIMNVCKRYEGSVVSNHFSLFGRYTLEIYVIHWSLLIFKPDWTINLNDYNSFWVFIIIMLLSLPIAYLCIGFSKVVEVSPKLRLLMFGRR